MSGRSGDMGNVVWLAAVIVVVVAVFALVGGKGLGIGSKGLGQIGSAQEEIIAQKTNDFANVCQKWSESSSKQDPSYILGGWLSSSIPSSAAAFGSATSCCQEPLRKASEDLKSRGVSFNPSDSTNWDIWNKCYSVCRQIVQIRNDCQISFGGSEDRAEYRDCLNNGVNTGVSC